MIRLIVSMAAGIVLAWVVLDGPGSGSQRLAVAEPLPAAAAESPADWREDYAYSLGVAAMQYAYPYWRMAHVRYDWSVKKLEFPASMLVPNQGLNKFWHATVLTNADWQEGGGPNNDTLYSIAWLNVDKEPIILSVPPMDRYYTFELSGMNSDNFAYVSELEHGRAGGHFALLPRGWKGQLPEDVVAVAEVPSPWILVGGRTYVAGEADLPAVHEIQKKYRFTTLSQWGQTETAMPQPEVFKPFDKSFAAIDDGLAVWRTINKSLTENPPIGGEVMLMRFFKEINVGPGLDIDDLDEASKRGLARAAVDGYELIKQSKLAGGDSAAVNNNGWDYSLDLGRAGQVGEFNGRSVFQSYAGIVANDAKESIYYGAVVDNSGDPLHGSKKYRIELAAGAEPDVKAFWSITMYDGANNLIANEINRYSIGDRTPNLVRDSDGGLTIALQNEAPTDPDVNWLPAPEGPFWLVLRAYQPGPALLDGSWELPPVTVAP